MFLRVLFVLLAWFAAPVHAQPVVAPDKVQQLIRLLEDPEVRAWIDGQRTAPAPAPGAAPAARSSPFAADPQHSMERRLDSVRDHIRAVVSALPRLPQIAGIVADKIRAEVAVRSARGIVLAALVFLGFGYGAERLLWTLTAKTRAAMREKPLETARGRLAFALQRLVYNLTLLAVFCAGTIGGFVALDWPPISQRLVMSVLLVIIGIRLASILVDIVLAPPAAGRNRPDLARLLPMPDSHATFWHRRTVALIGYYAIGWTITTQLAALEVPRDLLLGAAYLLGLGLLVLALEMIWRRPAERGPPDKAVTAISLALSGYAVLLWFLWVAGFNGLFWIATACGALPGAVQLVQRIVAHVVEPQGADGRPRSVSEVFIERGLRALVIIAGLLWLGYVLRIDVASMSGENALGWRIVRGLLTTVAVVLLADVTWHVIRAALDAKLASTSLAADSDAEASVRRARLRTILPILRNMILIAIAVIAVLVALSSLGVDIGPLIAGAGVFGVAIGFGAQTLVRDIISGMFYLIDDAFRVGEYIQSGSFKGTVESFSLRSVKLRHHRGPIYTVPFGQLGAVQNMSRDWVIDKLVVSVEYDTDLEKTRKLLKKVGIALQEDPELGPLIIEPLKMQGVEEFGDYAIKIRMKMTTRPGEQFTVRRKAYALIKQKFEEAGIKFAHPRVQVAGGSDNVAAAAHEMLELQKRSATVP